MTFGDAIKAAKQGKRITRAGWNGKDMFVYYQSGSTVDIEDLRCNAIRTWAFKHHGERTIKIHGHFDMKNAQGKLAIGWLASQTDMLAEDWAVLDD